MEQSILGERFYLPELSNCRWTHAKEFARRPERMRALTPRQARGTIPLDMPLEVLQRGDLFSGPRKQGDTFRLVEGVELTP
jgi:hypothetical protein